MRKPKFKCESCNKKEYTLESNIVTAKCCWKEFSIDYLYLHEWRDLKHTR